MLTSNTSIPTLNQKIASAIVSSPHLDTRRITVRTSKGCVVLCGQTETWFAKQMAQESLRGIEGVVHIDNQLVVDSL